MNDGDAEFAHSSEERLVKAAAASCRAPPGIDADEVNVSLTRTRRRDEATDEPGELVTVCEDETRRGKVLEEEAREHRCDVPTAPPVVDARDDDGVVALPERAERKGITRDAHFGLNFITVLPLLTQ